LTYFCIVTIIRSVSWSYSEILQRSEQIAIYFTTHTVTIIPYPEPLNIWHN